MAYGNQKGLHAQEKKKKHVETSNFLPGIVMLGSAKMYFIIILFFVLNFN